MTIRKPEFLARCLLIVLTICCATAVVVSARAVESLRVRTTGEQEPSETRDESALPAAHARRVLQRGEPDGSSSRWAHHSSRHHGGSPRNEELRASRERPQSNALAGRNGCGATLRC